MIQIQGPVSFREVLPSAMLILMSGALISLFSSPWQWFGELGWLVLPYGALLGVLIYLLGFLVSCSRWTKTKAMHELLMTLHQLFRNFTWPQIFVVSALAGIGEELLIRGVLQTFLVNSVGPLWGIISASLVFGLLHFMTKTYVFLTFVLGLLFGIAFYYSDSIVLVMFGHMVYDIVAFAMIVKFPQLLGIEQYNRRKSLISEKPSSADI